MINKYSTTEKNLYLFISHKIDGKINGTYGMINEENTEMIEFHPEYGPLTHLQCENILEVYTENYNSLDRGNWTQNGFDESPIKDYLKNGELKQLASFLTRRFQND